MRPVGKRAFVCLIALTIFFLISPMPDSAESKRRISVTPGTFEFSVPAGTEASNSFLVSNEGDENISHIFVYATNVRLNRKGVERYDLPRPDEPLLSSPASWVYIKVPDPTKIIGNFPFIDLSAGDSKRVDFIIRIPPQAPPGDYTTIVFFEARDIDTQTKLGTVVGARVGCRLKIRIQGEIYESLSIQKIKVNKVVIGNSVPYEFVLANNGNIDSQGDLFVRISNLGGRILAERKIQKNVYIYAKSRLNFSGVVSSEKMGAGPRKLEVLFRYENARGKPEVLKKSISFLALPLYIFYAGLVAFSIVILFVSFSIDARLKKKGEAFKEEVRP